MYYIQIRDVTGIWEREDGFEFDSPLEALECRDKLIGGIPAHMRNTKLSYRVVSDDAAILEYEEETVLKGASCHHATTTEN